MTNKSTLILVLSLLTVAAAKAQSVVNFDVPGGAGGNNYSGQGALSDPGNNFWNPVVIGGTNVGSITSSGLETPVTLTDASSGSYADANGAAQGTNGTPAGLLAPYAYTVFSLGTTVTDTLSNVPEGTYNLYLYGGNGTYSDRGDIFTAFTDLTPATTLTTDGPNGNGNTFAKGVNYVEFIGLQVDSTDTVSFTYTANSAVINNGQPNNEGDFNGLQLQQVITAPEPACWAYMLVGVFSLIIIRRFRRVSRV